MNSLVDKIVRNAKTGIFTFTDVLSWGIGSRESLRVLVSRAMASGDVKQVRRGLYCLSRELSPVLPNPLVLANHIYGPSYVSMESALEFHNWIPEAVYNVTNVTNSRCRRFETDFGVFSYECIKQTTMMAGVDRMEDPSGTFFVAHPLKALCDLVAARRQDWTSVEPLIESLRIEGESLDSLTAGDFDLLADKYYSKRVGRFLAGVRKELGL